MPLHVKICGLSTPETLDAAIAGGASHVGFVIFPKSPRHVNIAQLSALLPRVPAHVKTVGVIVDPDQDQLQAIGAAGPLDILQLHGAEDPAFAAHIRTHYAAAVWKAIAVRTHADLAQAAKYHGSVDRILFDAKTPAGAALPGGMGVRFDWALLDGYRHSLPWALSGGLDAGNVAHAVRITHAPLIDVSSGVESAPGIKAVDKIAAFLKATSHL
jgi:phosphoribosylanthranilate isomerase